MPEQESIDEIRGEARVETLRALRDLELLVRADTGMGGMDAIRIGVMSQQLIEKVRIYRMAVNVGDEPTRRARIADAEHCRRRGLGRRRPEL